MRAGYWMAGLKRNTNMCIYSNLVTMNGKPPLHYLSIIQFLHTIQAFIPSASLPQVYLEILPSCIPQPPLSLSLYTFIFLSSIQLSCILALAAGDSGLLLSQVFGTASPVWRNTHNKQKVNGILKANYFFNWHAAFSAGTSSLPQSASQLSLHLVPATTLFSSSRSSPSFKIPLILFLHHPFFQA